MHGVPKVFMAASIKWCLALTLAPGVAWHWAWVSVSQFLKLVLMPGADHRPKRGMWISVLLRVLHFVLKFPWCKSRHPSFEHFLSFFLKFYLLIFRERGREGQRGEKHLSFAFCTPPTRDLACMCPDWELNQRPFGSQVGTLSTQPHQPGLDNFSGNFSYWCLSNIYNYVFMSFLLPWKNVFAVVLIDSHLALKEWQMTYNIWP